MSKTFCSKTLPVFAAGLIMTALPVVGQGVPVEGPVPTTATITVQSKSGAPLDPDLIEAPDRSAGYAILSVQPIPPQGSQIAILIDDGLRFTFGSQLKEFADFINALPPGTNVLVGYMQNGMVRGMNTFTANHEAAAATLRLPTGISSINGSPYFTISEFVKHWPSNQRGARFVLMITNGIDPYNGRPTVMNQNSPVRTDSAGGRPAGRGRRVLDLLSQFLSARRPWKL